MRMNWFLRCSLGALAVIAVGDAVYLATNNAPALTPIVSSRPLPVFIDRKPCTVSEVLVRLQVAKSTTNERLVATTMNSQPMTLEQVDIVRKEYEKCK